jgi:outer membrane protein
MKKSSGKVLLMALGLSIAGTSTTFAQQQGAGSDGIWSLAEAVTQAKQNNLQIKQSQLNRGLVQADLTQSNFSRLPSINGNASHSYNYGANRDPLTGDFLNAQRIRSNNLSASASVPLFAGFQQVNLIKQNRLALQASEQDVLASQNDITLQVITSYLNILFTQELIKTRQLQRDLSRQQLNRTTILFKSGSVAENAVLDLQSQLANDEFNLIEAQNQLDISRVTLIQLLNLQGITEFQVEVPEIPEPDENPVIIDGKEVYETALQTQPAIKAADLRVLSAARALDVARGSYYPTLSFGASIFTGYSTSRSLFDDQNPEVTVTGYRQQVFYADDKGNVPLAPVYVPITDVNFPELEYGFMDQLKDNVGKQLSFTLQIPVFNGFQSRINVQRAKLSQQNAGLNADIAKNNLRQTIEQAYVDAVAAQRKYVAAKEQITAAEKNYRNAELRLNSGVINTVDFNVIANNFNTAQSNLIQAKYDYTFKLKVLDFYQGKDLSF